LLNYQATFKLKVQVCAPWPWCSPTLPYPTSPYLPRTCSNLSQTSPNFAWRLRRDVRASLCSCLSLVRHASLPGVMHALRDAKPQPWRERCKPYSWSSTGQRVMGWAVWTLMSRVARFLPGSPVMDDKEYTNNDVDECHRASSIATPS